MVVAGMVTDEDTNKSNINLAQEDHGEEEEIEKSYRGTGILPDYPFD